jgi:hypothetical protein
MKSLKTLTGDALEQMIDYKVVDQNGDHIGSLHSLWSDPSTGAVEFLGVKTGWLFGHNHVVPADKAEFDEIENVVRLPYPEDFIKEAPTMSADSEISEAEEDNIYRYYGTARSAAAGAETTGTPGGDMSMEETRELLSHEVTGARTAPMDYSTSSNMATLSDPEEISGDPAVAPTADSPDASDSDKIDASGGSAARWRRISRPGSAAVADDAAGSGDAPFSAVGGGEASSGGNFNPDPISGEPGAHPVGTGVGAASGGVAGVTIGAAVGGPIGAAVGGVAGAVGGGLAGKGVAESIDPTAENAYWESHYRDASYYEAGHEYSDYAPAYRVGYEGYDRFVGSGRDYLDVEPDLEREYMNSRGASSLGWEKAKAATRDAWERLKSRVSAAAK